MERLRTVVRVTALLVLVLVATAGCGLFNNASRERQEQNAPLTRGVVFGEVVMAEGIGSNNAPVNVTDTFSASQDFIYVVAEANRIEPGTTMFARWSHEGQPFEDSAEIQADQFYEDTFVEFHLENLQDRMEEGEYTVQIFVNGNPAEEVQFRVE